jgi:hypothetical protein
MRDAAGRRHGPARILQRALARSVFVGAPDVGAPCLRTASISALDAMATGDFRNEQADAYTSMPVNSGASVDVVVRGAQLVIPGQPPVRVDISFNYDEPLRPGRARVREIGDLDDVVAFDTVSAAGLFIHPAPAMLTEQGGKRWLRVGANVQLTIRRGADAASEVVRELGGNR